MITMGSLNLISIGITCFNAAETIILAISSALRQDYPHFEVIVVDDGSTDDSCHLISSYIKDKPNVRLVRHEVNKGFPAALNTLIANASGEYIAFFDDDDVSVDNRLSLQIERIKKFEEEMASDKILCYSNRYIVLPGKKEPDHVALSIGRKCPEPSGENVIDFILWHSSARNLTWGLFGSCTLMMKLSFLREIGGFDESFRRSAEWDMAVRAAEAGAFFIAVDIPLITQYKTPTSDKAGNIPLKYAIQLREKHKTYLRQKGVYLASLSLLRFRHYWGRGYHLKGIIWMAFACLLAPKKILWEKVAFYSSNFFKAS